MHTEVLPAICSSADTSHEDSGDSFDLSFDGQMQFNDLVMNAMGLQVPHSNLTTGQYNSLRYACDELADGSQRLVVAPLFPSDQSLLQNRQKTLRNFRSNFPGMSVPRGDEPLWTPSATWAYGQLLRDPESVSTESVSPEGFREQVKTGMRYLTADGGVVNRTDYLNYLDEHRLAVRGDDDTLWTYNFVDMHNVTPRSSGTDMYQLFDDLGSPGKMTTSPEQEIAIQALRIRAGFPNVSRLSLTNEAVYELGRKGKPKALLAIGGVQHDEFSGEIKLFDESVTVPNNTIGVRQSINGLVRR